MADIRLLLPLKIGHVSEMLDTLTPSGQTQFRWTVFVQSAGSLQFTDRSVINKVIFELHPDFANPKRTVKEPPFEVTETGYAGFVIPVQISFTGVSKTYKVMYDMNLVLEKQSHHYVDQLLLIKQPSNEFYELAMKYGARVKKEKKRKDKHHSGREYEEDTDQFQKNNSSAEKSLKKKKKTYSNDAKAETSGTLYANEHKVAIPTTSTVASKNFPSSKTQKSSNEEAEKNDKVRNSFYNTKITSPPDHSRGSSNGRMSPAVERFRTSSVTRKSPLKDRSKSTLIDSSTFSLERQKASNSQSPLLERPKSASKEKLTPPTERSKNLNNDKLSSPSDSSKNYSDDQSPPPKKRKQELSVDTLLSVQKNLMDIGDAEKMFAVVDAIFSSSDWPVPSLEYSEDTKILSFDLFALDPALILRLEELCRR